MHGLINVETLSEPKDGTYTVLKLTVGRGLTEAGIEIFEHIDWKEQRVKNG
jgi:hypothetical protein